jgi:hypothetical protein
MIHPNATRFVFNGSSYCSTHTAPEYYECSNSRHATLWNVTLKLAAGVAVQAEFAARNSAEMLASCDSVEVASSGIMGRTQERRSRNVSQRRSGAQRQQH